MEITPMQHRPLGATGLKVSAIGLGCAQIGSSSTDYAVGVVQRALDLGVTYLDVARGYRDAEVKIGLALQDRSREGVVLATKTSGKTRDQARQHLEESLQRLGTDYVDVCHLHGLRQGDDMEQRLGDGGALEALIQAKEEGLVRHIGCTSHRWEALVEAIERFPFEAILVPMNLIEREPLKTLIPLCQERGVGVTIMKPVATGLLPGTLALKWLLNQPISTAVPGATTIEEVEENALVGHCPIVLTDGDQAQIEALHLGYDRSRCRVCGFCAPCPKDIGVSGHLGTDVMYDHYRTMGPEGFRAFDWSREAVERDLASRREAIAAIESCDNCGQCEARCPYGLPVMEMLPRMLPAMREMVAYYEEYLQ
jgi:uncharacterized protein